MARFRCYWRFRSIAARQPSRRDSNRLLCGILRYELLEFDAGCLWRVSIAVIASGVQPCLKRNSTAAKRDWPTAMAMATSVKMLML